MSAKEINMLEIDDKHKPTYFGSKRPKIWLRREPDERKRCFIRTYILSRGRDGELRALANLEAIYSGKPVLVE